MAAPTEAVDEHLKTWATEAQEKYIDAVNKHGSFRAAARALGVNFSTVYQGIAAVKKRAARKGYSPGEDARGQAPEGFNVRGKSTLYDREGKIAAQWVKTAADAEAQERLLREFAATLAEDAKGLYPLTQPPDHSNDDILCVYPMGDPHFGMYAWAQEAGEDFDLSIAERLTFGAVDRLVASAPPASTALLLNLGDMYHADNQKNQSQSGHQLDVDGRWAKVQQVGLRAMLHCAKRLLERHAKVIIRFNKGNHDGHSSQALALMVSCYFHNEPRIEVDLSPAVMWYFQFGKVLIASTHGDTIKGPDMLPIVAADRPAEWGQTEFRYVYVGHVHHSDLKEYRGGVVEYFRTLAARDAWHAGMGYRAGRDMRLIVHHRQHGEIERHRCDVGMIE
jgi:molybdenum-dependent DNA-binding transcriptional regulator ModE